MQVLLLAACGTKAWKFLR